MRHGIDEPRLLERDAEVRGPAQHRLQLILRGAARARRVPGVGVALPGLVAERLGHRHRREAVAPQRHCVLLLGTDEQTVTPWAVALLARDGRLAGCNQP